MAKVGLINPVGTVEHHSKWLLILYHSFQQYSIIKQINKVNNDA